MQSPHTDSVSVDTLSGDSTTVCLWLWAMCSVLVFVLGTKEVGITVICLACMLVNMHAVYQTILTGRNVFLPRLNVGRSDRFAAPFDNMGRQGSWFSCHSLLSHNIPVRL